MLLDILTEDPQWLAWSVDALAECAERSTLAVNPLVYAEVSIRFERIEELEAISSRPSGGARDDEGGDPFTNVPQRR